MAQLLVMALSAGAIVGLATAILAQDGELFTAVRGVITKIVTALDGIFVFMHPLNDMLAFLGNGLFI